MRVRLGTLRRLLREEAWVPGRWMPGEGEPLDPDEVDHLGDILGIAETDDRMVGDGEGNGVPDVNDGEFDMADHLRGDDEKQSLGDAPDETMMEHALLKRELQRYFLQEGPAGAGMVDPREPKGAYSAFDMNKDHMGTDDLSSTWYKSPGRPQGTEGDPYRSEDPYAQLGFHPPKAQNDPTASPPAVDGEEGTASRLAPPIWQLSAGGDTSKVLGANAKPDSGGGESGNEPEEGEEGAEGEGEPGAEGGEAEGEKSGPGGPQRGRN